MPHSRFSAIAASHSRKPIEVVYPDTKTSEYFGMNVFDKDKMKKYLPKEAYRKVIAAIDEGEHIDRKIADLVALGMKAWAMELGATHYTHWFQPLNASTAEKHDGFLDISNGEVVENFDGGQLFQQEPDASSFPSGGIRNTFEARGYTAWDPSSPAFIVDKTLCIPTIFVSYTGEALDYKTPLLRSVSTLDKAAVEVCQFFDKNITKVISTLGWEQEYFLVDEAVYNARPDLYLTERTLLGHASAKDQQLEDHYFSAIPQRVKAFMADFEIESHKLGIPVKTRHNEVAPNQFECAPIFEEMVIAVDHNQLIMNIMKKTARKHNFRILFHEKPFKNINGSGKHNNWSMATNTGVNLLAPGSTPKRNLLFLTFLVNTVKAVYDNQDILRASVSTIENSHRLGAAEAPPSIMSVFLGSQISKILDEIENKVTDDKMTPDLKTELKLNVGKIPEILLDNTDRNRTSPFAFTGNRFEFRAVGSSANCAGPMTVLNTAVAKQLYQFKKDVDAITIDGNKRDEAIFKVLRSYIIHSKNVLFEGNGYSQEWIDEAASRGLTNITNPVQALEALLTENVEKLFTETNVLSKRELHARHEILVERITNKLQIEARVLGDLANNHIIPTVIKYQNILIENVKGLRDLLPADEFEVLAEPQMDMIRRISKHKTIVQTKVVEMIQARKRLNKIEDSTEKAHEYYVTITEYMKEIRHNIDKLELIVDDDLWPLPKYRELLFTN
ncbi:MAG: glutamine synthetase [Ignavibacteria bacterium GWF2_33_9]|nr:MAG: glutamine synthetase [Ignavibacteria bacterium GWF2_33_9]